MEESRTRKSTQDPRQVASMPVASHPLNVDDVYDHAKASSLPSPPSSWSWDSFKEAKTLLPAHTQHHTSHSINCHKGEVLSLGEVHFVEKITDPDPEHRGAGFILLMAQ